MRLETADGSEIRWTSPSDLEIRLDGRWRRPLSDVDVVVQVSRSPRPLPLAWLRSMFGRQTTRTWLHVELRVAGRRRLRWSAPVSRGLRDDHPEIFEDLAELEVAGLELDDAEILVELLRALDALGVHRARVDTAALEVESALEDTASSAERQPTDPDETGSPDAANDDSPPESRGFWATTSETLRQPSARHALVFPLGVNIGCAALLFLRAGLLDPETLDALPLRMTMAWGGVLLLVWLRGLVVAHTTSSSAPRRWLSAIPTALAWALIAVAGGDVLLSEEGFVLVLVSTGAASILQWVLRAFIEWRRDDDPWLTLGFLGAALGAFYGWREVVPVVGYYYLAWITAGLLANDGMPGWFAGALIFGVGAPLFDAVSDQLAAAED